MKRKNTLKSLFSEAKITFSDKKQLNFLTSNSVTEEREKNKSSQKMLSISYNNKSIFYLRKSNDDKYFSSLINNFSSEKNKRAKNILFETSETNLSSFQKNPIKIELPELILDNVDSFYCKGSVNSVNKENNKKRLKMKNIFIKNLKKRNNIEETIRNTTHEIEKISNKSSTLYNALRTLYKDNLKFKRDVKIKAQKNKFLNLYKRNKLKQEAIKTGNFNYLNKQYMESAKCFCELKNKSNEIESSLNDFRNVKYLKGKSLSLIEKLEEDNEVKRNLIQNKNSMGKLENKKYDGFAMNKFCKNLSNLNSNIAYQHRYFLANKLGFNWDIAYSYKKKYRNFIIQYRNKKFKNNDIKIIFYQKPDDLLI